jgi:hypothetical protein
MPRKARVFIASSRESVPVAYAIQQNLELEAEVTVWDQNTFRLNGYALEELVKRLDEFDCAVFVCTPTDKSQIREQQVDVARDNVIFELGLFIGRQGRDRCFVVQPHGVDLHLPSDFAGIVTARYEPNRTDRNMRAALGPACNQILEQIRELPLPEDGAGKTAKVRNIAVVCYRRNAAGFELLLTRTSGGRWILPKGRRVKADSLVNSIQAIGRMEAGALGKVDPAPIGSFRYLKNDKNQEQEVSAFLLEVERLEPVIQSFRQPTWFDLGKAAELLAEGRGAVYGEEFRVLVEKVGLRLENGAPAAAGGRS